MSVQYCLMYLGSLIFAYELCLGSYLFLCEIFTEERRDKESLSIHWLIPQMSTVAEAEPIKARELLWSSMWVQGSKNLNHPLLLSQATHRSRMGSGAV